MCACVCVCSALHTNFLFKWNKIIIKYVNSISLFIRGWIIIIARCLAFIVTICHTIQHLTTNEHIEARIPNPILLRMDWVKKKSKNNNILLLVIISVAFFFHLIYLLGNHNHVGKNSNNNKRPTFSFSFDYKVYSQKRFKPFQTQYAH